VLDIGGNKIGKRGLFSPPKENIEFWEYLNIDQSTNPDYCCNADNIPLPDISIDTVIMTELLEYLPNPKKVMAEIYRVTKNGGNMLISVPFLNPLHGDYWIDRMRYTPVSLEEMANEKGFTVKKLEPMGSVGAVVYDILRAAFGYADKAGRHIKWGKLLDKSQRLFFLLDQIFESQKKYINTGYFFVIQKS